MLQLDIIYIYVISNVCEKSLPLCIKISPFGRYDSKLHNDSKSFAEFLWESGSIINNYKLETCAMQHRIIEQGLQPE